ncbi:MAG: tetratricopeptide repeat protein [Verrucomicrobiota bacterium]
MGHHRMGWKSNKKHRATPRDPQARAGEPRGVVAAATESEASQTPVLAPGVADLPGDPTVGRAGRFTGWRGWLLRLALLMVAPLVFFGLLEGGLRVAGYGYPTGFFLGTDAKGEFISNHRFGWRFFPRSLARTPQRSVLTAKPAGTIRIFVLGSSAAMGTPDAAFSFGRILEVMLREQYPDTRFEVVNAAMTAINSHVVREIARDCAAREPDLFVVYMGNNEVVGPYGPGTVFQRWSPSLRMVRANIWVKSTRVGQWLGDVAGSFQRKSGTPDRWRGMEMFANNRVAADDPRLLAVYDSYRQNLTDICGIARRARAAVVLSNVAVNLRDCPPFASAHRPGLTPAQLAEWEKLSKAGEELVAADRPEALEPYTAAAKIDDRFADLQFRMGECLFKAGRFGEARDHFVLARDLDTLRFRADTHINAIVREVAQDQAAAGVRFVDAERVFAESDPDSMGIVGENLFYEHVHPGFDGNYLLARSVLDQARQALPQLATARRLDPVLSRQRCAEWLTLTAWEESQLFSKMVDLTAGEPFIHQLDHARRQAAARQRLANLRRSAATPEAKAAAWKAYEAAVVKTPDDWQLRRHFGMFAQQEKRPDVAVENLRVVAEKLPWDPAVHGEFANALADHGKLDEAIVHYRKALELKPDEVEAQNALAAALWRTGRADEAIDLYRKVLEAHPDHEVVHNNLASALVARKQFDEAIAHYRKAVELKPDYAEARKNLGKVLIQKGLTDEAIDQFQKSLEIKPDDAELHYKLGMTLADRGQPDQAIVHYKRALELKPDDAPAHNNLGVLLASRGQIDAAITHYQKALELKPDYAEAHNNLGPVLFQKGLPAEALAHFQKAVELKPDSVDARVNLGMALRSAGKPAEAIPHFQRALQLQPGNAAAAKNLNALLKTAPPR